ncbi:hypothetical protein GCM10008932_04040 [Alkalibacterium iburiense]|uniref:SWIM-type domain-containing protein n=1 Tax=Alkalibacterium iburiense TaxID=290589 RepID=A0ABP3GTD9_9LACT
MNINNFEEKIDPVILQRGIDYYLTGHVDKIVAISENTYTLTILGTSTYKVTVELSSSGSIKASDCTCPYTGGPICKHQVAAYYALKEDKPTQSKNKLADLLESIDKDTLIHHILQAAEVNPELETDLLLRLESNPLEQAQKIKQDIKDTINQYKGSDQFIHYNQSFDFTTDLSHYIDRISQLPSLIEALNLHLFLYKETIKALQYIDDSGGVITSLQYEILQAIKEKVEEHKTLPEKDKQTIMKKVKTTINSNALEDWPDTQVELLESFIGFIGEPKVNELYISLIDEHIRLQKTKPYGSYAINQWLSLKSQVIEKTRSKVDYQAFLEENKNHSDIRKKYFDWLLNEKQFEKLLKETKEAEKTDGKLPGLLDNWKEYRYKAFKEMNKVKEQKVLAFEFLMNGKYDYYDELKKLEDDHDALYQKVKEGFKQTNSWKAEEAFLEIMLEEEDTEELLAYVQKNPYYITRFSELLYPIYPKEVEDAFETIIKEKAKQASNRKQYKKVCKLISQYGTQTKAINKQPVIEELEAAYPHRPAFIDELRKV